MAWRRLGDKPLSEPMMVNSLTHICVTRPQWVKQKKSIICLNRFWENKLLAFSLRNQLALSMTLAWCHFLDIFLNWSFWILREISMKYACKGLNNDNKHSFQSSFDIIMHQIITWTNADKGLWSHTVSLGFNELITSCYLTHWGRRSDAYMRR